MQLASPPTPTPTTTPSVAKTPKEQGDDFEDFIVNRFDTKSNRFKLKRWRSDKRASNGASDDSNKEPDLEFEFQLNNGEIHKFAIECKWRQKFYYNKDNNLGIEWAKPHQMQNYKLFEKKYNIPVWVAIGIGGSGAKPDHVYLIKLSELSYNFVFETVLRTRKSKIPAHRFAYNPNNRIVINQY